MADHLLNLVQIQKRIRKIEAELNLFDLNLRKELSPELFQKLDNWELTDLQKSKVQFGLVSEEELVYELMGTAAGHLESSLDRTTIKNLGIKLVGSLNDLRDCVIEFNVQIAGYLQTLLDEDKLDNFNKFNGIAYKAAEIEANLKTLDIDFNADFEEGDLFSNDHLLTCSFLIIAFLSSKIKSSFYTPFTEFTNLDLN